MLNVLCIVLHLCILGINVLCFVSIVFCMHWLCVCCIVYCYFLCFYYIVCVSVVLSAVVRNGGGCAHCILCALYVYVVCYVLVFIVCVSASVVYV